MIVFVSQTKTTQILRKRLDTFIIVVHFVASYTYIEQLLKSVNNTWYRKLPKGIFTNYSAPPSFNKEVIKILIFKTFKYTLKDRLY